MKKLIVMLLLAVASVSATAQEWKSQTMTYSVSGDDTATDSDQILLKSPTGFSSAAYDVNVKLSTVRVSGTLAATVYCQGSDDNSNWYTLKVGSTVSPSITDTATITNAASAVATFSYPSLGFKYLRLVYNTTGTQVAAPTAVIYYRKRD